MIIHKLRYSNLLKNNLHYIVTTFCALFSLGCVHDGGLMVVFEFLHIGIIFYFICGHNKHFNMVYIAILSLLHESFNESLYGIGLISYIVATYAGWAVFKIRSIRYIKMFDSGKQMRHILCSITYVLIYRAMNIYSTTPPVITISQMCILFVTFYLCEELSNIFTTKRRRFSDSSIRQSRTSS